MDEFTPTPSDVPTNNGQVRMIGMEMAATSKRGWNDPSGYESVTMKCYMQIAIEPSITNQEFSDTLNGGRLALAEAVSTGLQDLREVLTDGKVKARRIQKFLGIPVTTEFVEEKTTEITLPKPEPMTNAEAGEYVTAGGKKFKDLSADEIEAGIKKLEAAYLEPDMEEGNKVIILRRRSALYALKGGQN